MVAPQHSKMAARIGKRALFRVLDPGAENPYWYFVLFFACNRTGMAADTSVLIDDKTKILRIHDRLQNDHPIQAHTKWLVDDACVSTGPAVRLCSVEAGR